VARDPGDPGPKSGPLAIGMDIGHWISDIYSRYSLDLDIRARAVAPRAAATRAAPAGSCVVCICMYIYGIWHIWPTTAYMWDVWVQTQSACTVHGGQVGH
jgi:hypothetical protein